MLPSSFRVGTAAQASIAAAGLAAAELRHRAGAPRQTVSVDMRHAATEFRSEHYLTIDGSAPAWFGDPLSGAYRAGDGRFVRLHMNFPHHRANVLKLLGCSPSRTAIEVALSNWEAIAFETEAYERGCVVAAMRSPDEWAAHPQAAAVAAMPVVQIEKIGQAPPRPLPKGTRSLSGLRVLDLTRIIAGPVAGRALAAHGADVMRISAPGPALHRLAGEGHGTRQAFGLRRYRDAGRQSRLATPHRRRRHFLAGLSAWLAGRPWVRPVRCCGAAPRHHLRLVVGLGRSRPVGITPRLRFIGANCHRL